MRVSHTIYLHFRVNYTYWSAQVGRTRPPPCHTWPPPRLLCQTFLCYKDGRERLHPSSYGSHPSRFSSASLPSFPTYPPAYLHGGKLEETTRWRVLCRMYSHQASHFLFQSRFCAPPKTGNPPSAHPHCFDFGDHGAQSRIPRDNWGWRRSGHFFAGIKTRLYSIQ